MIHCSLVLLFMYLTVMSCSLTLTCQPLLICCYFVSSPEFPLASITPSRPDPVVFGRSIQLNCSSVGRSPFNLSITVGDRVLTSAANVGRSIPLTYTLEITDNSSYTTYSCLSESTFGNDTATVTIVRASEFDC